MKKAFTLIELMLAVVIIGILAAMAAPRLTGRTQQAKISAAKADIDATVSLALDLFHMDTGRYPTTEEGLVALNQNPSLLSDWHGPYLKRVPKDPWGNSYIYQSPGTHNSDFDLSSTGINGITGDDDDIHNW